MKLTVLAALLLTSATGALAQNVNVNDLASQSASGAEANSGSVSGASSDNANVNAQVGNVGVSENTNTSNSSSGAISGSNSESVSGSVSDQAQGQSQTSANEQGQDQTQGQMQDQNQQLDAAQANSQGVTVNQTWNTKNRRQTEVRTNNAVPLTSSSSFSSDYCGGTVSGGVSAAPIGISLGASGTRFDKSCQSLRRSEKFGMAAVNAANMGQPELAGRLMSMMIWSICTSDTDGTERVHHTAQACDKLLLLGSDRSMASATPAQPLAAKAREPKVAKAGKVTPEAAARAITATSTDPQLAAVSKPPR
jgi:hypothetical protein